MEIRIDRIIEYEASSDEQGALITLARREQRDGSRKWAIYYRSQHSSPNYVWTRRHRWEWEPMPSSRTDAFLRRARWTWEEAVAEVPAAEVAIRTEWERARARLAAE